MTCQGVIVVLAVALGVGSLMFNIGRVFERWDPRRGRSKP